MRRSARAGNSGNTMELHCLQMDGEEEETGCQRPNDFWAEVSRTTPYIDSQYSISYDGKSVVGCRGGLCGSSSTPTLHQCGGGGGRRTRLTISQHNYSVRGESRSSAGRLLSLSRRFYSLEAQGGGSLRLAQPLLPPSGRSSLAAVWASPLYQYKHRTPRKPSSWDERSGQERRRSVTGGYGPWGGTGGTTATQVGRERQPATEVGEEERLDLRYLFQHPHLRQLTTLSVILCNFLLFAEDPISHSHTESVLPMIGNVFSFVCSKYPPDWRWALIKILMWILAVLCGLVAGKLVLHHIIFGKYMRLKMFRDEQGSWIAMFLTVIFSLFLFSHLYNLLLFIFYNKPRYFIDSRMGITNSALMKGAACGTWIGDLVTWLCVTDVMLQDSLYPDWAPRLRHLYLSSSLCRILLFWALSALATSLVLTLILSDLISWDTLNRDFASSTELSRAFLASFILVLDLVIMMQDWDFPHFTTTLHINLPGFSVVSLQWNYAQLTLTGKWFSYGVICMVMLLDLNMWKNQIFYTPDKYGQYVGPDQKIRTVLDPEVLGTGNSSLWTWESRSKVNPLTKVPFYLEDVQMNSRYVGYPLGLKCSAFLPSVLTLSLFIYLICTYGRFPRLKRCEKGEMPTPPAVDEEERTIDS